jgi:hypothetical protein
VSETALTSAVLSALHKMPGVTAWRCNSGVRGRVRLAPAGTPDIIGYLSSGRFLGIETKASHKDACACESCAAQRAWGSRAKANGVLYLRARTVAEAISGLGLVLR